MQFSLKYLFVVVAIFALTCLLLVLSGISKREHSLTAITVVQRAVHEYTKENGTLPTKLGDLNQYLEKIFLRDGWGRTIIFEVKPKSILIGSYGQDGMPGGSGDKSDIFRTFDCYDEHGVYFVSETRWLSDSLRYVEERK